MIRIPPFWRRLSRMILFNDLMTGRRVMVTTTDDEGNRHTSIEHVRKPMPPLGALTEDLLQRTSDVVSPTKGLTNAPDRGMLQEPSTTE